MELERLSTDRATGNGYTRWKAPGNNDIGYGTYSATMGVTTHGIIPIEPSGDALDRDYAQIAKMVLESEQCNVSIRNNFEKGLNVATDIYIPEEYRI
jgi:hypothetical protein